jgi:4-amino-4-deoxy-L-arabinose transferase-like glycosyltransferase
MRRDLTTDHRLRSPMPVRALPALLRSTAQMLAALALGALAIALAYQIPVAHTVDIGGYDAAYVQGFYDPERSASPGARPYLDGSDGSARWSQGVSYLVFPQAGLPAQITLRLRGWRASGPAPEVTVLLNGYDELGRFRAGSGWEEHTFAIAGGLSKPNDVVVELRSETASPGNDDPRRVGVLLDSATYRVGPPPITPYPAQVLYGALAPGMLYLVLRNKGQGTKNRSGTWAVFVLWCFVLGALFLLLYRAQPPYPYPLRALLPAIDGALAALLVLRYGPALARRAPALLDGLALGGLGIWAGALLLLARDHVVLSTPGVEKDFPVFASRASSLGTVLRADGFYNLGYPLLLWLARPLAHDNPFLAARAIAALSGALLLGASWWLARRLLGRGPALLALLLLALSPLVVAYALYLGTDMPFAALCTLSLALLPAMTARSPSPAHQASDRLAVACAGLVAGLAFLVRHPGILLLPIGWLAIWWEGRLQASSANRHRPILRTSKESARRLLLFTLAFLVAIMPQLVVNVAATGRPFYSQQAKNIWLAVFGAGDWGRWGEAANDLSLGQVVLQDPARFLANWWANLRAYLGTGGEDTSEFGRAVQLRLLGFPANWLAIAGMLAWLALGLQWVRQEGRQAFDRFGARPLLPLALLLLVVWVVLYVLAICVGFVLPRFFLPLAPIYAIAAAWVVTQWVPHWLFVAHPGAKQAAHRAALGAALLLIVLLWNGFATGAHYVLRSRPDADVAPGQPADEVAAVRLVQAYVAPHDRLVVRAPPRVLLGQASAIAHLAVPPPAADDPAALQAAGARYLLWSSAVGPAPAAGEAVATAGAYTLYRIAP